MVSRRQVTVRTRGESDGYCNICERWCRFTDDHVPPKGCVEPRHVRVNSVVEQLGATKAPIAHWSQNGMKFRTLCTACNSGLLGTMYDPELKVFCARVAHVIELRDSHGYSLPERIAVNLVPQKVARAVIGHLLAAEVRESMATRPRQGTFVNRLRQYFLDPTADLPPDMQIDFWPYPAKRQAVFRGMGMLWNRKTMLADFLKFFPAAFWVGTGTPPEMTAQRFVQRLPVHGSSRDQVLSIGIPTRRDAVLRPDWPEQPGDDVILACNSDACVVAEQLRRPRKRST